MPAGEFGGRGLRDSADFVPSTPAQPQAARKPRLALDAPAARVSYAAIAIVVAMPVTER